MTDFQQSRNLFHWIFTWLICYELYTIVNVIMETHFVQAKFLGEKRQTVKELSDFTQLAQLCTRSDYAQNYALT